MQNTGTNFRVFEQASTRSSEESDPGRAAIYSAYASCYETADSATGAVQLISGIKKIQTARSVPDFVRFLSGLGLGGTGFS